RGPHAARDGGRDDSAGAAARPRAAAGRRVPLRDQPVSRARIHLQARAHARGGLPEPAPRASTPGPRGCPHRARVTGTRHAPESVEVLAHHAVRGEVWTSAATYLYRAGAKAQAEARYGTAVTFYEASVDALQRLGDAADHNLELDAYLELWSTRISTGQVDGLGALGDKVEG